MGAFRPGTESWARFVCVRLEAVDVFGLENGPRVAVVGDMEHGSAELLGGGDVLRKGGLQEGQNGIEQGVEGLVELRLGTDAVQGLDDSRTEHVCGAEGEL